MATLLHGPIFLDLVVRHADFGGGLHEALGVGGIDAVGGYDFDSFGVDAGGVCGWDGDFVGGGGGGGWCR